MAELEVIDRDQIPALYLSWTDGPSILKTVHLSILTFLGVFFGAGLVFAATCSDDAEYCNETQICTVARSYSQGKFIWQTKPKYRNHVAEAKQRGLTCGVEGANSPPDTPALEPLRDQLNRAKAELAKINEKK